MIVKSLTLENIRSYVNTAEPIRFPLGITLVEGDIHSGKSTLLYAIEFALFGLGEFKGSFLLRNGSKTGSVTLIFEEDGKEYEVHRSLIRTDKKCQQDECYVRGPSGKQILSPTDLKEKILQILGFNEPSNPRAQSVIYRYAIFTPQEEMKEVIKREPDERLQTLRKAFRIEDYKIAVQNCTILVSIISNKILSLKISAEDLETIKTELSSTTIETKKLYRDLDIFKNEELENIKEKETLQKEWKKLDTERERLSKIEDKIPILNDQIRDKAKDISRNKQEIKDIRNKIENIDSQVQDLKKIEKPTGLSIEQLQLNKVDIEKETKELLRQKQKASQAVPQVSFLKNATQKTQKALKHERASLFDKEKQKTEIKLNLLKLGIIRKPTNKSLIQLKQERSTSEVCQKKIDDQISKLDERLSNFTSLIKHKICPLCEREVESKDFNNRKSGVTDQKNKLTEISLSLVDKIKEIDNLIDELTNFNESDRELIRLKSQLQEIESSIEKSRESISSFEKEEKSLQNHIRIAEEQASIQNTAQRKLDSLENEKERIVQLLDALKNYEMTQKELTRVTLGKVELDASIKKYQKIVRKMEEEKRDLEQTTIEANNEIKHINSLKKELFDLESKIRDVENAIISTRDKISTSRTSLQIYNQKIEKLKSDVKSKVKKLESSNMLCEYKSWLTNYFSPSLQNIEIHVMESLRRQFNDQFQRWFDILLNDPSLQVSINEDFTPQITNDGFDMDYVQLSGGERTTIALAYRLALNIIVQEVSAGGTSNLLILDEPTDGFSKEQLYRLREALCEIKCPQIIIVSHERELEGFASNIIRIENNHGLSKVCLTQK